LNVFIRIPFSDTPLRTFEFLWSPKQVFEIQGSVCPSGGLRYTGRISGMQTAKSCKWSLLSAFLTQSGFYNDQKVPLSLTNLLNWTIFSNYSLRPRLQSFPGLYYSSLHREFHNERAIKYENKIEINFIFWLLLCFKAYLI